MARVLGMSIQPTSHMAWPVHPVCQPLRAYLMSAKPSNLDQWRRSVSLLAPQLRVQKVLCTSSTMCPSK